VIQKGERHYRKTLLCLAFLEYGIFQILQCKYFFLQNLIIKSDYIDLSAAFRTKTQKNCFQKGVALSQIQV